MYAVDTNILVRLVTKDEPEQTKKAAALFTKETVFISKTVLLETEWVLRYVYEYVYELDKTIILRALNNILGLINVEAEKPLLIAQALKWCESGMDFADALHLASTPSGGKFVTFDEKLIKKAKQLKVPISLIN